MKYSPNIYLIKLQGSANIFYKEPGCLGLCIMESVSPWDFAFAVNVAIDNTHTDGHDCVTIKLYLKQTNCCL